MPKPLQADNMKLPSLDQLTESEHKKLLAYQQDINQLLMIIQVKRVAMNDIFELACEARGLNYTEYRLQLPLGKIEKIENIKGE